MKIKLIFILAACMLSQQLLAKESGGHKFWHGTGGKVVAVGVIWWIFSGDSDDDEHGDVEVENNQFKLYSKEKTMQYDLIENYDGNYSNE